jgi:hypothetical protein
LLKSGALRRKIARIDGLLVNRFSVQFDKINQHYPVRRLAVIVRSREGNASGARSIAFPIPQLSAISRDRRQVILQPLLVA